MVGVAFELVGQFEGLDSMDLEVTIGRGRSDLPAIGRESKAGNGIEVGFLYDPGPGSI